MNVMEHSSNQQEESTDELSKRDLLESGGVSRKQSLM